MKRHDMAGFVPVSGVSPPQPTALIGGLTCSGATSEPPGRMWLGWAISATSRTRQGFLYLAFVLDLASRRVVGISMAPHLKASLATDALREAIATRGSQVRGVVFHTDRGQPRRIQLVVATLGDEGGS